ncbi:alkaline phosphatase family protein [Microbacterium sp. A93]|uniref:alkaline phosphatase family protein n=1 Tax=Microbacterium sp. A93 TaxID=3450716 RepID=UPI003F43AC1D
MSSPKRAPRVVPTVLVSAILVAGASAVPTTAAATTPAADAPREVKTLVVGIDGASFDFLAPADMPTLAALRTAGLTATSNLYAQPMAPTVSGPGWSTIATGVWPDKHEVIDNAFSAPNFEEFPDYLTRIEQVSPERSTMVIGTWGPVAQNVFGPAVDERVIGGGDAGTTTKAVAALSEPATDDLFVHLDEVDGAGHSGGTDGAVYGPALQRADAQIGEMIAAIDSRATRAQEDWLIMVTSDHGHMPTGGHGGNTPAERKTFVIASGPGIEPGSVRHDAKLVDIAPTVLDAVGIEPEAAWNLDGIALDDLKADDFDSVRSALRTQLDETAPGADTLGWTHETPEGWSIDNSAMPEGGVREWAGWSFTTDEFFSNVDRGQNRENNVRSRNVFAVADSDEWDDLPHANGQFDSTLISPSYSLTGAANATLAFASTYYIDGPQSAEVLVSFDGGEPVLIKSYERNTNANERLTFDVPQSAESAQFRFRYTGTNSAFWAVDRVSFEQPQPTAPSEPVAVQVTSGDASATVTWQTPVADGHSPISGYTVLATPVIDKGKSKQAVPVIVETAALTATLDALRNGVTYTVTVTATNAYGTSSASEAATASPTVSRATPATPPAKKPRG